MTVNILSLQQVFSCNDILMTRPGEMIDMKQGCSYAVGDIQESYESRYEKTGLRDFQPGLT